MIGCLCGLAGIIIFGVLVTASISKQRVNRANFEKASKHCSESDLLTLGKVISLYNTEHQKYPTSEEWCDELLKEPKILEELNKSIICPLRGLSYDVEKKTRGKCNAVWFEVILAKCSNS